MALDRALVGRSYPPSAVYEVGRQKIAEFAAAIGENDPVHRDPAAARAGNRLVVDAVRGDDVTDGGYEDAGAEDPGGGGLVQVGAAQRRGDGGGLALAGHEEHHRGRAAQRRRRELTAALDLDEVFDYGYYVRHVPEALARLEAHNAAVRRVRCRVEKVFGTCKRSYGLRRMRWLGLAKAGLQVRLAAMAYKLRRTVTLLHAAEA